MDEKACFGVLDAVFPLGEEGLRQVPSHCFQCGDKTACLKAALETGDGLKLREQVMERTPPQGLVDRIRLWSERKTLARMRDEKKRER